MKKESRKFREQLQKCINPEIILGCTTFLQIPTVHSYSKTRTIGLKAVEQGSKEYDLHVEPVWGL